MAEIITLRAYLDDVSRLLERGAATEVISHCRYVLQHYPRNIETYRLLAQALLQRAQDQDIEPLFGEAAEVFQRVLSVLPNDYVAHVGLSEIREHSGQLDQAIWHMERAYEQIPGNTLLQEALRGLYGKRDGENRVPQKIHLTRGALARQYVNGQLYDQALIELRHALDQNPSRIDLQVMLAETLWESHHPVEAGEAAVQILKKLPDCLPANRILARLWLDNERPSDAQVFLDRVEALDPYAAAQVLQPDSHVPDPNRITRLDYSTEAQATLSQESTPDWVQDLGDLSGADLGSVFQMPPVVPAPTESPAPADEGVSFDWGGDVSEPSSAADDQGMPDWFSMMGDEPSQAASGQQAAMPEADWLNAASPAASGADMPDWFSQLGGPSEAASSPASPVEADWLTGLDDFETPESLFGEVPEPETRPETGNAQPVEAGWLSDFTDDQPSFEALSEAEPAEEIPSWLSGAGPEEAQAAEPAGDLGWQIEDFALPGEELPPAAQPEIPAAEEDWLAGFETIDITSFEAAEEQAPSEFEQASTEFDWMAEESASPAAAVDSRPSSGFTELLAGIEPSFGATAHQPDEDEAAPTPPEWLAAFGEEAAQDQESALPAEFDLGGTPEWLAASEPPAESPEEESWSWEDAQVEDQLEDRIEDRLEDQPEIKPMGSRDVPAAPQSDVPDWLTEPDSDFFALGAERPGEEQPSEQASDDWFAELEAAGDAGAGSMADFSLPDAPEDMLRAEALGDEGDWLDEQEAVDGDAGLMAALGRMGDEPLALDAEFTLEEESLLGELPDVMRDFPVSAGDEDAAGLIAQDSLGSDEFSLFEEESEEVEEALAAELPDWIRAARPDTEAIEAVDEFLEGDEVSPALFELALKEDTPVVEDWMPKDTGEKFEFGEPVSGAALDWLQPQAAEDDWLGTYARPSSEEVEPMAFALEESAEPEIEEREMPPAPAQAPATEIRQTNEWLAAIPDMPFEEALETPDALSFEDMEQTLFGEEEVLAEAESELFTPEQIFAADAEVSEERKSGVEAPTGEEIGFDAGDIPAWMADLEPVKLEGTPAPVSPSDDLFDQPYDPFESGSADKVPEYQSAKQTGILQPYENPDWMSAFGEGEVKIELEEEAEETEYDLGDQESFLSSLGIEAPDELGVFGTEEPELAAITDNMVETEEESFEAPVSEASEGGGMPDWLAAITSSAAGQFDDLSFEEEAAYSSSAEASGVVTDDELDWLTPLGEEREDMEAALPPVTKEAAEARLDLDLEGMFADVAESAGAERGEVTPADAAAETFDLELGEEAASDVEDIQGWFAETKEPETKEVEDFDFDFGDAGVAPASDLAHTKELSVEEDEEDEEIPDDFSFEEIVPRWLRRPKESDRETPSKRHDAAPESPDWLRSAFDDEEYND